jgi:hypothetical protein
VVILCALFSAQECAICAATAQSKNLDLTPFSGRFLFIFCADFSLPQQTSPRCSASNSETLKKVPKPIALEFFRH